MNYEKISKSLKDTEEFKYGFETKTKSLKQKGIKNPVARLKKAEDEINLLVREIGEKEIMNEYTGALRNDLAMRLGHYSAMQAFTRN